MTTADLFAQHASLKEEAARARQKGRTTVAACLEEMAAEAMAAFVAAPVAARQEALTHGDVAEQLMRWGMGRERACTWAAELLAALELGSQPEREMAAEIIARIIKNA